MDREPTSIEPAGAPSPERVKFRLRFSKSGDLRLVSHHDLMHCFERLMRRAELPLCTTQGFHPQPRMVFAQSLALGIAGLQEVLELEIKVPMPADEVLSRLVLQAPPGIVFHTIREIPFRASAKVRRGFYRIAVPNGDVDDRISVFLALPDHWIVRERPQRRRLNLRPFVQDLRLNAGHLEMALWITPYGAARPEEVVRALGLEAILEAGGFFERTNLELYDELPQGDALILPDALRELSNQPVDTPASEEKVETKRDKSHPPTSLIGSPLSFDS